MAKIITLFSLIIGIFHFGSCTHTSNLALGVPKILAGTSKITGRIQSPNPSQNDSIYVNIFVSNPISGEHVQYKKLVDQSGSFSIEIAIETDISLIGFYTSIKPEQSFLITLKNGNVTNVKLSYDKLSNVQSFQVTPSEVSSNDMTKGWDKVGEMIDFRPAKRPAQMYDKSIEFFLKYAENEVAQRLNILNRDTLISERVKEILTKDFRMFMYRGHVFPYKNEMLRNFRNLNRNNTTEPSIPTIDRSYFRFLKGFDLNNADYLYCSEFIKFQNEILQNDILSLPNIGDTDISTWLANVRKTLAELVGFDKGPYFDILAANAYGRQLNEDVKPLTERQKKNIIKYWKNGEIAKILFRKNRQVAELDKLKSPAVVNDISSVPDNKVIETILSKYKNKVIFIDLWATWCGPCLNAMEEFRSTKNSLKNQDVRFVYLTNRSSPQKLWEKKIKGIGNEHYYLSDSQWEHVMNQVRFDAIPSYLLYNKEGVLINKFTAFPGKEEVKKMINDLL